MVFFAIWWAWRNLTWFASAYDTDDVPYRLMTLLRAAADHPDRRATCPIQISGFRINPQHAELQAMPIAA